jgi:uncharacterized repeat protein (TIGR03803 family)
MKTCSLFGFLLRAALPSVLVGQLSAQTFTTLHSFTALHNNTNSDGVYPSASLTLSEGILYGTAGYGGSLGNGTVFELNTDGMGFTTLHTFAGGTNDGSRPNQPMLVAGTTLYGTAFRGGNSGAGSIFAINTNGTGFTNLHSFTGGNNGDGPYGALILSGDTLYGTTIYGGTAGAGTVFAISRDGTGFRILYNCTAASASPSAGLVLTGNTLYGTSYKGGGSANGTVFSLNTDGAGFTTLYNFSGNSDGAKPNSSLVHFGSTLYGTTQYGGGSGNGTIFAINTNGTGFATIYVFSQTSGPSSTNSDGVGPSGGLLLSGNTLYGMAVGGGQWAGGTVFAINTDGTGFATLYSFTLGNGGAYPYGGLTLSGNKLYGTTHSGGSSGQGTVFNLPLPVPRLKIVCEGDRVILAWPTNATGVSLLSTTDLGSPSAWTPVSPAPVVVNGQNAVTNPVSGTQRFFRLSQ